MNLKVGPRCLAKAVAKLKDSTRAVVVPLSASPGVGVGGQALGGQGVVASAAKPRCKPGPKDLRPRRIAELYLPHQEGGGPGRPGGLGGHRRHFGEVAKEADPA